MQSKDRELLHHVLFSFKNYHDRISRIDTWLKLTDEVKEIYQTIIKTNLFDCQEILKNSWRYYLTYLKVLETLIDSNYKHNDAYLT